MRFTSVEITPSLTPTSPYSRASATRHDRGILFVNTYEPKPSYLPVLFHGYKYVENIKPRKIRYAKVDKIREEK